MEYIVRSQSISDPLAPQLVAYLRESMNGVVEEDPPYVFVVFGASGDLAKKKIYPTLWYVPLVIRNVTLSTSIVSYRIYMFPNIYIH